MRRLLLFMLVVVIAVLSFPAFAGSPASQGQSHSSPQLMRLTSFETELFQQPLALNTPLQPHEVASYLNRWLGQSQTLHYASPAEGVIHLECQSPYCYSIHATVTTGANGPVVWETNERTSAWPCYNNFIIPCVRRNERTLAHNLVKKLERAYQGQ